MGKYIHKFSSWEEFDNLYYSEQYLEPWLSCVEGEEQSVEFNKYNPYRGYNMVDLGLPSGTLWADRNVGASSPEDGGDFFFYGWPSPIQSYNSSEINSYNETFYEEISTPTDSYNDTDVPSNANCNELTANTTHSFVTVNGVDCLRFSGNGNSIVIPLAGYYNPGAGMSLIDNCVGLWSASCHGTEYADMFYAKKPDTLSINGAYFANACKLRLVYDPYRRLLN